MTERSIAYQPVADLVDAVRNPKQHHASLGESVERFGFVEPITVDERTGRIVSGHGRRDELLARQARGEAPPDGVQVDDQGRWMVPVVRGWSSADDAEAEAFVVAANRVGEAGGWDDAALATLLTDLASTDLGLTGVGYSTEELDELLVQVRAHERHAPEPLSDPDEVPPVPAVPVSKRGDLWLLGRHRVLVGDCRDPDDVARLLNGAKVNVAFTSPPYADRRKYDETSGFEPIHPDAYVEWFAPVAANVAEVLADDGSWFVNIRGGADGLNMEAYVLDLVLAHAREWGWHWAAEFCWERNGVPGEPGRRFKNQWEPIYQFARGEWKFRPLAARHWSDNVPVYEIVGPGDNATLRLTADGTQTPRKRRENRSTQAMQDMQGSGADVGDGVVAGWAYPGNRLPTFAGSHEATGHSAAFPVGLPAWFLRAYSDEGDVVFDPFLGSGSTLLAAQQEQRVGYGCEISPGYVDVTCARWERFTGEQPILASTGEPHSFLT